MFHQLTRALACVLIDMNEFSYNTILTCGKYQTSLKWGSQGWAAWRPTRKLLRDDHANL